MMRVEIINTIPEFEKLRNQWVELYVESGSDNIFITFEWQFLYWKFLGRNDPLFILAVFDAEKLKAVLPLMINKRFGFRELRFISYPISDYDDILLTKDEAEQNEAIAVAAGFLSCLPKWSILKLQGIAEGSPVHNLLRRLDADFPLCSYLQQHCDGAPQVNLACGWDAYCAGLRGSFVSDIRAFQKRAGKETEYIPGDHLVEKDLPVALENFMDMYTKRIKEIGGKSLFEDERMREFFCAVSLEFFRKNRLELSQYKIDGLLAAMEVGFINNGRFFRYLAAFDSQFRKCSVARLLLFQIIKRCFEKGIKTFDFMLGEEDYKRFWNPVPRKLFFWTLHKKTISGYASFAIFNRLNLFCKKLMKKKW